MKSVALPVERVTKRYKLGSGGTPEAVLAISFEVNASECFGLLGPNGAGKSTTINCVTGFYRASSGSVSVCGMDVYAEPIRPTEGACA